jgi:tight adherence protein B
MNEVGIVLGVVAAIAVVGGTLSTIWWRRRADMNLVRARLAEIFQSSSEVAPQELFLEERELNLAELKSTTSPAAKLARMLEIGGTGTTVQSFILTSLVCVLTPLVLALFLDLPIGVGVVLAVGLPFVYGFTLSKLAARRRMKFIEQLPGAIDLMISVLRSGLSVPQSLKAVGEEFPAPCGPEFLDVLHRVNLGQSLADSLSYTVARYGLFELDLLRRAAAIQVEIGGSLAELLEKTNGTLRQRLKLVRQVEVLTAQSRLSGTIIALLPIILGIAFEAMNPNYLGPLFHTSLGKLLLVTAVVFQIAGIISIRKLSTIKV